MPFDRDGLPFRSRIELCKKCVIHAIVSSSAAWQDQGKEALLVDDRALIVGPAMERAAAMRVDLDPDALPCLCKLNEEVGKPSIINPVVGGRRRMLRVYDPTYDVALVCRPNPVHDALVPAATAVAYLPQRL